MTIRFPWSRASGGMSTKTKTATGAAAALVLATGLIAGFEGYVPTVYRDSVGVQTYCYGETQNPRVGHTYTRQECDALLKARVAEFQTAVRKCVTVKLPAKTEAAFVSAAYNIGKAGFCGSSMARYANAGNLTAACNALPMWNKGGNPRRAIKGLTVRRGKERSLCLEGVREGA